MVVVVAHEPSSQYVGEGFVLVGRADALEFDDARVAQALLDRHAPERASFVTEAAAAQPAA